VFEFVRGLRSGDTFALKWAAIPANIIVGTVFGASFLKIRGGSPLRGVLCQISEWARKQALIHRQYRRSFEPELEQRFAGYRELLAPFGSGDGCSGGSTGKRTNPSSLSSSG
jgi:hypothetical protein